MAFATWIDGRNLLIVNGARGEPYDNISWPIALTNETIAYAARLGDRQYCVIDGKQGPAYLSVGLPAARGREVAYAASDGEGWFVVRGGVEGPRFDWIGDVRLGMRLAYVAERRGMFLIVVDGEPGPAWDRVTAPAVAEDGSVAYGGLRGGEWFLVHDDRETRADGVIAQVFAGHGRAGCVLEGPSIRGRRYDWIGWPAFTPGGRLVFFASRGSTKLLVVEDREIALGAWTVWDPVISPDGRRIGFGARNGRELTWMEMDIGGEP